MPIVIWQRQGTDPVMQSQLTRSPSPTTPRASVALIVQKFGGTSVGTLDRIRNVATRAIATQKRGHDVVVIVSAMSGETNRLLALAHQIAAIPDAREMDALAATGEQVSAALTAISIQAAGGSAPRF